MAERDLDLEDDLEAVFFLGLHLALKIHVYPSPIACVVRPENHIILIIVGKKTNYVYVFKFITVSKQRHSNSSY